MTFAVGIFDLFTYTIPGSLYLAFFGYLGARLHWIDPGVVGRAPVLVLVIAIVVASYLLGYLAYPLGAAANRVLPRLKTLELCFWLPDVVQRCRVGAETEDSA